MKLGPARAQILHINGESGGRARMQWLARVCARVCVFFKVLLTRRFSRDVTCGREECATDFIGGE
jgi:hypothetical protein